MLPIKTHSIGLSGRLSGLEVPVAKAKDISTIPGTFIGEGKN